MTRNSIASTLALAAMAIALAGCHPAEPVEAAAPSEVTVHARLETVGKAEASGTFLAYGTVRARLNASLQSKILSRVETIAVREGDEVKQGQVLIHLESRDLQASSQSARAAVDSGRAALASAETAYRMEISSSKARIASAQSQVHQSDAALASAKAKLDLAIAGPRTQEVSQTHIAVVQAESSLKLAKIELDRTSRLVAEGAMARRDLDLAQNQYDLAKGQYENAVQTEKIARDGTRSQDLRAAKEAVAQAEGAVRQSRAGLAEAQAAALQVDMRRQAIQGSAAQSRQAQAGEAGAEASLSYARITAPFGGRVTQRMADPGSMASPGVPLLVLEGGEFRLEATVPERLVSSLKTGMEIPVFLDSHPVALTGRVAEILPQGDSASHTFLVKISLPQGPGIKSGMFGRAEIPAGSIQHFTVPTSALANRDGLRSVFAVDSNGTIRLRIVTDGDVYGDRTEILSGLSSGDRIVVDVTKEIVDGAHLEGGSK